MKQAKVDGKSVCELAYEILAADERRARRIKKVYAPAPPKKDSQPRAKRAGAKR